MKLFILLGLCALTSFSIKPEKKDLPYQTDYLVGSNVLEITSIRQMENTLRICLEDKQEALKIDYILSHYKNFSECFGVWDDRENLAKNSNPKTNNTGSMVANPFLVVYKPYTRYGVIYNCQTLRVISSWVL